MINTIIFDLGNVIVNVNDNKLFKDLAAVSDKNVFYIKNYYEGSSARKTFERGKIKPKQFYERIARDLNLKVNFSEFKKLWCGIFTLNEDVARLIKDLKRNFKLVLLSNVDALRFEHIKNSYKIVNIFDEYVLSYKIGHSKPNPIIFINALIKSMTMPYNCIYFDDISQFIYVARLMGIKAFQYKNFDKLLNDLNKFNIL